MKVHADQEDRERTDEVKHPHPFKYHKERASGERRDKVALLGLTGGDRASSDPVGSVISAFSGARFAGECA